MQSKIPTPFEWRFEVAAVCPGIINCKNQQAEGENNVSENLEKMIAGFNSAYGYFFHINF